MEYAREFQMQVHPQPDSMRPRSGADPVGSEPLPTAVAAGFSPAGVSGAWRKLLLQAEIAARHVQIATVEGESGVGKQMLARHLLSRSALSGAPFRRWDAREWLLSQANGANLSGFIYLDRVDMLAAPGQGLLLGILKNLQDRVPGRVMLVASSQTPLRQMAGQGQFLPDLAFRLTAVRFSIPPLRARREDIAPTAQALLDRICARYQHKPVCLSPAALGRLLQHSWPGNARELACVLEGALLEASSDVIRPEDLAIHAGLETPASGEHSDDLSLDDFIRRHVQYVLDLNHGNKLRASGQLRISRSTLYRILGNHSILSH